MMIAGNGTAKKKIATKAAAASAMHRPAFQRALSDPDDGFDDDRQHRGLQPKEQRRHNADLAPCRIDDS